MKSVWCRPLLLAHAMRPAHAMRWMPTMESGGNSTMWLAPAIESAPAMHAAGDMRSVDAMQSAQASAQVPGPLPTMGSPSSFQAFCRHGRQPAHGPS